MLDVQAGSKMREKCEKCGKTKKRMEFHARYPHLGKYTMCTVIYVCPQHKGGMYTPEDLNCTDPRCLKAKKDDAGV